MDIQDQLSFDFGNAVAESAGAIVGSESSYLHGVAANSLPTQQPVPDAKLADSPIPYSLKVSARAKQVYLRVVPGRGVVVTIPKRYPRRAIPELVESQRVWIQSMLDEQQANTPESYRHWPPQQLHLAAIDSDITIQYKPAPEDGTARADWIEEHSLCLQVDSNNKELVARCIAGALKTRARQVLGPWTEALAVEHGLNYKKLTVRGQRSLWGSYSSSGTLSLNYKLLFLSADLVDYVVRHELAHTRVLDHSPEFWQLLESIQPGSRKLDQRMNDAGSDVPPWLELAL